MKKRRGMPLRFSIRLSRLLSQACNDAQLSYRPSESEWSVSGNTKRYAIGNQIRSTTGNKFPCARYDNGGKDCHVATLLAMTAGRVGLR